MIPTFNYRLKLIYFNLTHNSDFKIIVGYTKILITNLAQQEK